MINCEAEVEEMVNFESVIFAFTANNTKGICVLFLLSGHDVWNITLSLNGGSAHPAVASSLASMLSRKQLNPGDITTVNGALSTLDLSSLLFSY